MLGGLAFKRLWQHRRRAEGASTEKPNLIMSSAVQVCWEKFCNYFEVEASLDAPQPDLRPGLSGVAKIDAGYRPLAWLLFHRAATWLRLALWSIAF